MLAGGAECVISLKHYIFRSAKSPGPQQRVPEDHAQKEYQVETGNRKLIRPSLTEVKDNIVARKTAGPAKLQQQKKIVPPDQTNAENYYYVKQMQSKTPMTFVLQDGETLTGVIEWYDKGCLKVNREDAPNLLLFKHNLKYLYKAV